MLIKNLTYLSFFVLLSWFSLLISSCQSSDNSSSLKSSSINNKTLDTQQTKTSLGTNLSGIADWSPQRPFIDQFKSSRKWATVCKKSEPGCQTRSDTNEYQLLDLDENGWVKSLPSPEDSPEYTRVSTALLTGRVRSQGHTNKYIVLYDGEGAIEYRGKARKIKSESQLGRDVIEVNPSHKGVALLTITETDPQKTGNYIRNIRVIAEDQEKLYRQGKIFNPLFLEKTKPFTTLRFMDWMKTNNSTQKEWDNRPKVTDARYSLKGVPIEIMVALANKLEKNAWFNMPHQATDEYIANFAHVVKKSLNPELKVYVEFSNEVWNWGFQQAKYALAQAEERWGKGGNARMDWYGMRTAQMCDIWKDVFKEEKDRVNCVISTQTAYKGLEKAVLDCPLWVAEGNKPCYQNGISTYAITGYFGGTLGIPENQFLVKSWLNQADGGFKTAFEQLEKGGLLPRKKQGSLKEINDIFAYHKQVAKEKGLQLVAYEGGQHIVGVRKVKNDKELTSFFIELNRRPEMYHLYMKLLNSWQESGGGLFMHFSDVRRPDKHGSWGALEYLPQPSSPKYDALMDFIDSLEKENTN